MTTKVARLCYEGAMEKYFDRIEKDNDLVQNTGANLVLPPGFQALSASLITQCSFLQNLIQQIIYISHGPELIGAKRALKEFPNPKARCDFLCDFPYREDDPVLVQVFDFSRTLFREIYELRNVLAHEIWASSDRYEGAVIFSTLDENSRLAMASGRLWHDKKYTPKETYDATIRFIRKAKVVRVSHLETALENANICAWALMNISNVLNADDEQSKTKARQAFFVFGGTSHLFAPSNPLPKTVKFSASKNKTIT